MRQSFLFALIVVILGAALYALYFIEGAAGEIEPQSQATTTTGDREAPPEIVEAPQSAEGEAPTPTPSVRIGGVDVHVTIAATPEERSRGLGGTAGLAENEGMLFVFSEDGIHSFWMKDMRFSIDILWLSVDGTVVHIEDRVAPESYPASFSSSGPARYVLEVSAGFAEAHNIAPGDRVVLPR